MPLWTLLHILAHPRRCFLMAYFVVYSMSLRSTLDTSHARFARLDLVPEIFSTMSMGRLLSYHRAFVTPAPAYSHPPLLLVAF